MYPATRNTDALAWDEQLARIERQVAPWQRRKQLVQVLCPLALVLVAVNFMWGPSWTLRILTLPALCLLTWVFLWGITLPPALKNQLVDAVDWEPTTDELPTALRLLALLRSLGIRHGAEALQVSVVAHLPLVGKERLLELGENERALLRHWVAQGAAEEKLAALLVLTTLRDEKTVPLAKQLAATGTSTDARVREAAEELLTVLWE
jgi:hypothetical protein